MENDVRDKMEEQIFTMCDERSKMAAGSEEKLKHDANIVKMFDAYNDRYKIDSSEYCEGAKLEFEKDKLAYERDMYKNELEQKKAELTQKEEEAEKKTKLEKAKTALYGLGLAAGVLLSMLARKDEREGFMVEDKVPFLDKFRREKP